MQNNLETYVVYEQGIFKNVYHYKEGVLKGISHYEEDIFKGVYQMPRYKSTYPTDKGAVLKLYLDKAFGDNQQKEATDEA